MRESSNVPYVKKYDENGNVSNPIKDIYKSEDSNRRTRRDADKTEKFYGESANHHLSVVQTGKYRRRKQIIHCKNGEKKTILHYDLQ
jgi:hypothetical protein